MATTLLAPPWAHPHACRWLLRLSVSAEPQYECRELEAPPITTFVLLLLGMPLLIVLQLNDRSNRARSSLALRSQAS
eukprot:1911259-Amphidinium_carterae.1